MLFLLRSVGGFLGIVAYYLGVRSEVTRRNIARALPEFSKSAQRNLVLRTYANIGQVFLEFIYLRFAPRHLIERGVVFENLEECRAVLLDGTGTILLSGHNADWEWIALSIGAQVIPIRVLKKTQRSNMIVRFLEAMRSRFGNKMVDVADMRKVFRALSDGEPLAILGDQAPFPDSVRVPFFGELVPTFEGTARIALRTRAPIIFFYPLERTRKGYRVRLVPIPYNDLVGPTDENIRILTARHAAMLEDAIRHCPSMWLWQHRRWKHDE